MKRISSVVFYMAVMAVIASQAYALNIVLTNDDGYSAPNIRAMYKTLKAQGHDVIVSAPLEDQSSKSAGMDWFVNVALSVDPNDPDIHIVDGTSVMAVLYGIDILSKDKWGAYPDLVISGPNEGNNLGIITNHSGTIGAAVTALYRGIPAIAVSAAENNNVEGAEEMIARIAIRVVAALSGRAPLLPPGTGISLNIPPLARVENADDVPLAFSEIGTSGRVIPKFTMDLGRQRGSLNWSDNSPDRNEPYHDEPGISFGTVFELKSLPETARHPEARLLSFGKATISVINVTYAAGSKQERIVQQRLRSLVR